MSYRFCILIKRFARSFEDSQFPFPGSCFSEDEKHLFLITNNESWLSLKKSFSKACHHSKCFCRYYKSFVFSTCNNFLRDLTLSLKISPLNNSKYVTTL